MLCKCVLLTGSILFQVTTIETDAFIKNGNKGESISVTTFNKKGYSHDTKDYDDEKKDYSLFIKYYGGHRDYYDMRDDDKKAFGYSGQLYM